MCIVQSADGHDKMPGPEVEQRVEGFLDPELLQFQFTALLDFGFPLAGLGEFLLHRAAGSGMLELDFGLHAPALAEIVSEIDHGVGDVKAAVRRVAGVFAGTGIAVHVVAEKFLE